MPKALTQLLRSSGEAQRVAYDCWLTKWTAPNSIALAPMAHAPNRELIPEAMDESGYKISEAPTASEALQHLRCQRC